MNQLNTFNKVLIGVIIVITGLLVQKVIVYRASDRYYYASAVSSPREFPVRVFGIWFNLENGDTESGFYKDVDRVNSFYSDWGVSEYAETYKPQFLPESLFLEYVDCRTQNYYLDTIILPKEKMITVFKETKRNHQRKNLSYLKPKIGLQLHVGIANDGNIIFWLIGEEYETELFLTQLKPRIFPDKITATNKIVSDKEDFIKEIFSTIPDSI